MSDFKSIVIPGVDMDRLMQELSKLLAARPDLLPIVIQTATFQSLNLRMMSAMCASVAMMMAKVADGLNDMLD